MRVRSPFHLAVACLLVLTSVGGQPITSDVAAQGLKPDPAEGERLAKQWCTQCHLIDDGTTAGADAGPPFAMLAADPDKTEEALRGFLHHPQRPMPALELSNRDIDHLVAYIRSLDATK